ncbi:hypothetical protein [Niveibacterium terrae]|uniref:hypothetical protein n=1 Tax=Niveibacterium terrae TaxID=3373598 RepID=UPI003A8F423C
MTNRFISKVPCLARAFFGTLIAAASGASLAAAGLDFDKTFTSRGEPRHLHFEARFLLNAKLHEVEVWREGSRQLRRRTDAAIETFLQKPEKDAEWHMSVLDLKRRIRTDIDRSNLYRVGHFTDWFSLAHALVRPTGSYSLTRSEAPEGAEKPLRSCRWYALSQQAQQSRICWSADLHLPMLITDSKGKTLWQVSRVDLDALGAETFRIRDAGFVRNDANEDISGD